MIFVAREGPEIGYTRLFNGFYHLDVEKPVKQEDPLKNGEIIAAVVNFDDPV